MDGFFGLKARQKVGYIFLTILATMILQSISSGFISTAGDIEDGKRANKENQKFHPKIDSIICRQENIENKINQFLDKQQIRDSTLIRSFLRIEEKMDKLYYK